MYLNIHTYLCYVGTYIDNICDYAHIPLHNYIYYTYPTGIMQTQPTNQESRRGDQYNQPSAPSKSYSAPQQTAGPGGLHSNY